MLRPPHLTAHLLFSKHWLLGFPFRNPATSCDHGLSEFLLTQVYHSFKINACICFTDLFFLQLLQLEGFFFLSVCCKCPVACPLVFLLSFVHVLLKPFCWGILWAALIGTTTPDMFPVYCSEKLENANFRAIYGACLLWFPTDDE